MKKGFTLIEVLVSVSIFAVVMVMALGALLAMTESNRRVEAMKSVINTLNFSLDSMTRSIRTGTMYRCGSAGTTPLSCASTHGTYLTFLAAEGTPGDGDTPIPNVQLTYCRGNGSACSSSGTAILRSIDGGPFAPITSSEVVIRSLKFYVIGAEEGDDIQPRVIMLLSGHVVTAGARNGVCGNTATCTTFNLQTSVTQRIYDQ